MIKVFIDGQAGTTGLEIVQRLSARDDVELLEIDPDERKSPAARQQLFSPRSKEQRQLLNMRHNPKKPLAVFPGCS